MQMFQTQKRVLVVDDELNQRTAVAAMIERWGFQTTTAADGAEALERLREFNPDAIVTRSDDATYGRHAAAHQVEGRRRG